MGAQNLVVVTGMSGSGKGSVLKAFEDLGYICVDNLPVNLIPKFAEGTRLPGGKARNAAFVVDIRAGEKLGEVEKAINELRNSDARLLVLYLEARDGVLVRRYSETRRPHPLSADKPLLEAIRTERKRLRRLSQLADVILDTSDYTVHQAKAYIMERFRTTSESSSLNIHLMSFGYRHGIPIEADLVFDTRFLPNPHFVRQIKDLSGRHRKVIRYMRSFAETNEFVKKIDGLLKYLLPKYAREGKSYLTIAVGCTGGRHRSVFVAEELAGLLKSRNAKIRVRHRDINL
jgi:UPF0042 nucleotide-binding protein